MAETTQQLTTISTEDLSALLELAHDLDLNIEKTHSPYMQSIYTRLRAEVSKDIRKAQAAQEREESAAEGHAMPLRPTPDEAALWQIVSEQRVGGYERAHTWSR